MRRIPDTERLYELVGQKIERQRREVRLSQTKLAERCGLARGSIANIEGGNQRPTLHTLWSIAEALDMEVHALVPSREEFSGIEVGTTDLVDSFIKKVSSDVNRDKG